ncbi:hypothetical protein CH063_11649 [Colletotrichum higginsianum]|uniref:C2H2-type domain-containing protein n=1 Tax=Colletotrichum higginsianum (strain IMI 349063) TaxID=759273 RepID=H1VM86_COLHI|nr:hypothetical protein CH063_11649 [Colletotrichum higginsianum]
MSLDFGLTLSAAASGISFCEMCDKPFTQETALKRHQSYCRRARTRPRIRPKPCRECSAAKCKCSLQPNCARCIKKGLDCVYPETTNQGTGGLATTSSAQMLLAQNASSSQTFAQADILSFPPSDGLSWGSQSQLMDPNNAMLLADGTDLGLDFAFGLESLDQDINVTDMTPAPEVYKLVMSSCINGDRSVEASTTDASFPLRSLCAPNPVAESSANLIRQALRSYPHMMLRRSSFPPFIHPHQDKDHLPEPLANCMSIAVLFAARNRDTRQFLWKSIREEQDRNLREMANYSQYDVFAALQAELIYIIMRVVDGGGAPTENRD